MISIKCAGYAILLQYNYISSSYNDALDMATTKECLMQDHINSVSLHVTFKGQRSQVCPGLIYSYSV